MGYNGELYPSGSHVTSTVQPTAQKQRRLCSGEQSQPTYDYTSDPGHIYDTSSVVSYGIMQLTSMSTPSDVNFES